MRAPWIALTLAALSACSGDPATMPGDGGTTPRADVPTMPPPDGAPPDIAPPPDGAPPPDVTPPPPDGATGRCTPDPALIARRLPCRVDSQCPCGSHCDLGVCIARCSATMACEGGQRCDSFGRCRAPDDTSLFPAPPATPPGTVEPFLTSLVFARPDTVVDLRYMAKGAPVDRIRWVAPAGMEVRCAPMEPFAAECIATALMPDTGRVVSVRQRPGASPLTRPQMLRGFHGTSVVTVSAVPAPPAPTGGSNPWVGEWTGSLTIRAVDLRERTVSNNGIVVPDMPPMRVRALVHASTTTARRFQLIDEHRVLDPDGELVGTFTGADTATAPTLTFPDWRLFDDGGTVRAPGNPEVDVAASVTASCTAVVTGTRTITCRLDTYYAGVLNDTRVPYVRMELSLTRRGPLPAGATAPALPSAYASRAAPAAMREAARTPWEQAVAATFEPVSNFNPTEAVQALAGLRTTAPMAAMGRGRLDACQDGLLTTPSVLTNATVQPLRTGTILARLFSVNATEFNNWVGAEARDGLAHALYRWMGAPMVTSSTSPSSLFLHRLTVRAPAPVTVAGTPANEVLLPCGFRMNAASVTRTEASMTPMGYSCRDNPLALPQADLDFATESCNRMAAALGCTVETLTAPEPTTSLSVDYLIGPVEGTCSVPGTIQPQQRTVTLSGVVTRVCRLRTARPVACAELALCAEPTNSAERASMASPRLGTTTRGTSNDVACAVGERGVATDLEAAPLTDVIDKCRRDRNRSDGAVPMTPGTNGAGLRQVFRSEGCLDVPRLLYALGEAGNLRRGASPVGDSDAYERTDRLTLRLTQQWLAVHALMASESASAWHAIVGLRGEAGVNTPQVLEGFQHTVSAWRLLFHPRFSTPLLRVNGDRYRAADYRSSFGTSAPMGAGMDEPRRGLPPVFLQLLGSQLAFLDERVQEDERRDPTSTLARDDFGRVARSALVALPLAIWLADRAGVNASASADRPNWKDLWDASLGTWRANLGQCLGHLDRRLDRRNPLGIEDIDFPLYYQGDNLGPSGRFSAVSDYLLGASPTSMAVAPVAIARAEAALPAARDDYGARYGRRIGGSYQGRDEVTEDYGTQLAALCGTPPGLTADTLLTGWTNFNAGTCFLRSEDPVCRTSVPSLSAMGVTDDDVRINNCYRQQVRVRLTSSSLTAQDQIDLDEWARGCDTPAPLSSDCMGRFPMGTLCVACATGGTNTGYRGVLPLGASYLRPTYWGTPAPGSTLLTARTIQRAAISPAIDQEVRAYCQSIYPSGRLNLAGAGPSSRPTPATCYRGQLGELALAMRAAAIDVEIANQEMGDLTTAYDIAMQSCFILQMTAAAIDAATTAHNETMQSLRIAKATCDSAASVAGAVKDVASTTAGVDNPMAAGALLVTGVAAAAQSVSEVASIGLQAEMDRAQAAHEQTIMRLESMGAVRQCINDAQMNLVGTRTAALRVLRAEQEMQSALFRFNEAMAQAQSIYDEGTGARTALDGDSTAAEAWNDNPIDTYLAAQRAARRAAYLAVRAVEYELQASLMARQQVLAASRPADLTNALAAARMVSATRTINGRRPSSLMAVISLRDNVLQLGDTMNRPMGWNTMTSTERLRALLNDSRYVVAGGRRIPFTLAPVPGTPGAISFLTGGSDCAERLWSVNASVLGTGVWRTMATDDAGTSTGAPSFVRIDLLKSNTFFSNWCTPMMMGSTALNQLASVRPSRNLFLDPETPSTAMTMTAPEETLDSRARIQAYLGVPRAMLENETYANGSTSELAARGLYGNYALFIPNDVLVQRTGGAVSRPGIELDNIDDILLRVDYVSVSR